MITSKFLNLRSSLINKLLDPEYVNFGAFKYILILFTICVLAVSPFLSNAYAEIDIQWLSGAPGNLSETLQEAVDVGRLDQNNVLTVNVTDTDSVFDLAVIDQIEVNVTSTLDPDGTILLLNETGVNTNKFLGESFVFLVDPSHQFLVSDTVTLRTVVDPDQHTCDTDGPGTILSSDDAPFIPGEGLWVYSDTQKENAVFPNVALFLNLVETEVECTFETTLSFTTDGPSDPNTGTLQVTEGDIITIWDPVTGLVVNAQIIPASAGKGSIFATWDDPDDNNTHEVTATYLGVSAGIDLQPGPVPGGGGGGLIRSGLVLDSAGDDSDSGSDSDSSGSGCSGDCSPPTLGLDSSLKRIVSNGFSYNGNPVDVEQFYTPYPLITVQVGEPNRTILKIYDNGGTQNIAHVELGFGLGKGESFSENRAAIILDRTRDGRESVTTYDPENVLDNVKVSTTREKCSNLVSSWCLVVTIDHTFRESLKFNMVGTQVWDFNRNSWQNFYNHGVHIIGDSLNPPKTKSVAFGTKDMKGLFTLTRIDKIEDKWIDEFGNVYLHRGNDRFVLIESIPRQVIEDYVTMHGCDRMCNWFDKYKENQEMLAKLKLDSILGRDITNGLPSFTPGPSYSFVSRSEDPILQKQIADEIQRAESLFDEKFEVTQNFELIRPSDGIKYLKLVQNYLGS